MDIIEKKIVDMLTQNSVSIATDKFIKIDGIEQQIGQRHRISYENSEKGREKIQKDQPEDVVASVFAIWGDTPTVNYSAEELPNNQPL